MGAGISARCLYATARTYSATRLELSPHSESPDGLTKRESWKVLFNGGRHSGSRVRRTAAREQPSDYLVSVLRDSWRGFLSAQ
jgi:hypothetical protein